MQMCNQNFFQDTGGFLKLGHFDKHLSKNQNKKPCREILEFVLPDTFETTF